jgi:hypothetical protein
MARIIKILIKTVQGIFTNAAEQDAKSGPDPGKNLQNCKMHIKQIRDSAKKQCA